jgi:hypothetical protein
MLGPVPAVKFCSFPPRGKGLTADKVRPWFGSSNQLMPLTDVFLEACAASIEIPPSPSTKPIIVQGNVMS